MWRKIVTDRHTDTPTEMQHTDPASPRTGLGKNCEKIGRGKKYLFMSLN